MSLQTDVNFPGKGLDGAVAILEDKAKKFVRLVGEARKKEALAYFRSDDFGEEARRYVKIHPNYKWMLKAAQMQF